MKPSAIGLTTRLALPVRKVAQVLGRGERTLRQILPDLPHAHAGGAVLLPVRNDSACPPAALSQERHMNSHVSDERTENEHHGLVHPRQLTRT